MLGREHNLLDILVGEVSGSGKRSPTVTCAKGS